MDLEGRWEDAILARLDQGFSGLGRQLTELKVNMVNQRIALEAESTELRQEFKTIACLLQKKGPSQEETLANADCNALDVSEAEGDHLLSSCPTDKSKKTWNSGRTVTFTDSTMMGTHTNTCNLTPGSLGVEHWESKLPNTMSRISTQTGGPSTGFQAGSTISSTPTGGLFSTPPSQSHVGTYVSALKTPRSTSQIALEHVTSLRTVVDEIGDKSKKFKLRDFWEVDDATLQRLSLDSIQQTRVSQDNANKVDKSFSRTSTMEVQTVHCAAIHPHSVPRLIWDLAGMLLLCYDFVWLPLQAFEMPDFTITLVFNWITRVYWTLDIVASFMTGHYQHGKLEMRFHKIAVYYARRWLLLDCLIVASEWALVLAENGSSNYSYRTQGLLRGVRAARFIRLLRLMKLQRISYVVEARVNSNYMISCLGILRLLAALIILIHLFACAWYWVGQSSDSGWVYATGMNQKDTIFAYVSCFQWSLHQFHPNTEKQMSAGTLPERFFMSVCALMGLAISSAFVSCITNTMVQLQYLQGERTKQLRAVREYVSEHSINLELALRAKKYVKARLGDALKRNDEKMLLELLPNSLLSDLHDEARRPILVVHKFFKELHTNFPRTVHRLCHEAVAELDVHRADVVFQLGDICKRFFFLERGKLRYYTREDTECGSPEGTTTVKDLPSDLQINPEPQPSTTETSNSRNATFSYPMTPLMSKSVSVYPVSYLSEATLWTYWEHRGYLKARADSVLLTVNAVKFASIMKDTAPAFLDAVVYAKKFLQRLNDNPVFRSDLIAEASQTQMTHYWGTTQGLKSWATARLKASRSPASSFAAKSWRSKCQKSDALDSQERSEIPKDTTCQESTCQGTTNSCTELHAPQSQVKLKIPL